MKTHGVGLSPGSIRSRGDDWIRQIVDFWSELRVLEQTGATSWDVLEPLERKVTEALNSSPPDKFEADSATAEALAHIAGISDL